MIEITIKCESADEARTYLNAPQYLNLLQDFYEALRGARKHGTDADVLLQVEQFYPDLAKAIDHNTGAY